MRVALITHTYLPNFVGGRETFLVGLAKYMVKKGIETEIFTGDRVSRYQQGYYEHILVHRFPMRTLNIMGYPYRIVSPSILSAIHKFQPDLIHCLDYRHFTTDLCIIYSKLFNIPILFSVHGLGHIASKPFKKILWVYDQTIGRLMLSMVTKIVAYPYKDALEPIFKNFIDKIVFINPALDLEILKDSQDTRLRSSYDLEKKVVVLSVGRETESDYKGHKFLLKTWDKMKPENCELVIVGHDETRKLGDILILPKKPFSEVCEFYEASDIYILPSRFETCGRVILEALCYGLPVIATPVGIAPYILNGENGFVVQHNDIEGFKSCLYTLSQNNHKLDREKYRKLFDWNIVINDFVKLYKDMVNT